MQEAPDCPITRHFRSVSQAERLYRENKATCPKSQSFNVVYYRQSAPGQGVADLEVPSTCTYVQSGWPLQNAAHWKTMNANAQGITQRVTCRGH